MVTTLLSSKFLKMKVLILFAVIALILQRNGSFQNDTSSLARGQADISDVSTAEKMLLFEKLVPLLDAMMEVYEKSQILEYLSEISLKCYLLAENEPKLASFNLILASVLYSSEKKCYEEKKIKKVEDRRFYVKEFPLYARLITKFSKLVDSAYDDHYDTTKISEIVKTAKSFAKAYAEEPPKEENINLAPFMDSCVEVITLVDINRHLFLLYFEGIQATINEVFEKATRKIARDPRSKMAQRTESEERTPLSAAINDEIRAAKLNVKVQRHKEVKDQSINVVDESKKSVTRRGLFDFLGSRQEEVEEVSTEEIEDSKKTVQRKGFFGFLSPRQEEVTDVTIIDGSKKSIQRKSHHEEVREIDGAEDTKVIQRKKISESAVRSSEEVEDSSIDESDSSNYGVRRRMYFDFVGMGKKLVSTMVVVAVLFGMGQVIFDNKCSPMGDKCALRLPSCP